MVFAEFLTDFGNAPILVLLSLALCAWIAVRVSPKQAALWLLCVAAVTSITALLKAWFAGCHYNFASIHSPSGHTSFSVIAYGGVATVLAAGTSLAKRRSIVAVYLLWVLGIGLSRVLLHDHTPQEVLSGYLIGALGVGAFASHYRADSRPGPKVVLASVAAVVLLSILPPMQLSFESELGWLGSWFVRQLPICV